jgi:hypothetical protein
MTVCGLYVPLPEHVSKFCQTIKWNQCPQYLRGCDTLLELNWKRGLSQEKGRRRYPRLACRHNLALVLAAAPSRQGDEPAELQAWTMDLGLGGMRVQTGITLPEGAEVLFVFGEDFPVPGFAGRAEVRWQRGLSQSGVFQWGLGFIDQQASRVVSELLKLRK